MATAQATASDSASISETLFDLLFENSKTRKPFEEYSEEERNALNSVKFWKMSPDEIPDKYFTVSFLDYLIQFKECKNFLTYWRCSLIGYRFAEKGNKEGIEFIRRYITDDTIFYQVAIYQNNMEMIRWLNENRYHRLHMRNYRDSQDAIYELRTVQCLELAIRSDNIELCQYLDTHNLFPMRGRDTLDYLRENQRDLKKNHNPMYEYLKSLFHKRT
jgi:hypothetical protein